MKKLSIVLGAALLASTAMMSVAKAADELTITSWGGAYSESQRKAYYEPYIAAGNKITEAEYSGEIAKVRAMVEAKAVTWDVVDAADYGVGEAAAQEVGVAGAGDVFDVAVARGERR